MAQKVGYRSGDIGEYTGGDQRQARIAWKALNYEYTELGNEHLVKDVATFLGVKSTSWDTLIKEFKQRYGDMPGIWLSKTKRDAELYSEYGDPQKVPYFTEDIIVDLGGDGIFVLDKRGFQVKREPILRQVSRKKSGKGTRAKKPSISIAGSRR